MKRLAILGLFLAVSLLLLLPALDGSRRLAFRDVGHFYFPLYHYIQDRSDEAALPLWNPHDQFGIPLAGETTTALFYPGRIVFFVGLPIAQSLTIYVLMHVWLAGLAACWVARRCGLKMPASLTAGLAYALSGPVIFLYTNPPFLVGAAWLPLAFWYAFEFVKTYRQRDLGLAAAFLAMMILGGDVQNAFHVMLIVAFAGVGSLFFATRRSDDLSETRGARESKLHGGRRLIVSLGLLAVITSLTAAIQIVPSSLWSRHSNRRHEAVPGVQQLLRGWSAESADGAKQPAAAWWMMPQRGSHARRLYDYSSGPWEWAGITMPGICGRMFPENTRVTRLIPASGRTWAPSLYLGIVPAICFLLRLGFRSARGHATWSLWEWTALAGLGFSLGCYGFAWVVREVAFGVSGIDVMPNAFGGLGGPYWMLVSCVPGYAAFRYPAKWLVFFCLGGSISAAHLIDRTARERTGLLAYGLAGISTLAILLFVGSFVFSNAIEPQTLGSATDSFFGPLNLPEFSKQVRRASLHALVVCGCFAGLMFALRKRVTQSRHTFWIPLAMTALIGVDLFVHAHSLVATVPLLPRELAISEDTDGAKALGMAEFSRSLRLDSRKRWPKAWTEVSSGKRLSEAEWSQRLSLYVRWHLMNHHAVVNSPVSISSQVSSLLWASVMRALNSLPLAERDAALARIANWLAVETLYKTKELPNEDAWNLAAAQPKRLAAAEVVQIVNAWDMIKPHEAEAAIKRQIDAIVSGQQQVRSTIESADSLNALDFEDAEQGNGADSVSLLSIEHEAIEIVVHTRKSALLKYHQFQDVFWFATVRPAKDHTKAGASISQTEQPSATVPGRQDELAAGVSVKTKVVDGVAQGFVLPAGDWRVRFEYRPTWLMPATLMTLLGWAMIATLVCWNRKSRSLTE